MLRKNAQTCANNAQKQHKLCTYNAQTFANIAQTLHKLRANTEQTLRKHYTNVAQTLRKRCANILHGARYLRDGASTALDCPAMALPRGSARSFAC
jgi:hypothetical protein